MRFGNDTTSASPEAIRSAYATAIDDAQKRYKELERAVALLANERERTEMAVRNLEKQRSELDKGLEAALAGAESDPANPAHREAGTRYLSLIEELDRKRSRLTEGLQFQKNKVDEYKEKLRSCTSEIGKLKREQNEMVAEFISSQQLLRMEDRLRGMSESVVDESIVAIREKVSAIRSQAKIASEMRGTTLESQDATYARLGYEKQAAARFDELLKARRAAETDGRTKDRNIG